MCGNLHHKSKYKKNYAHIYASSSYITIWWTVGAPHMICRPSFSITLSFALDIIFSLTGPSILICQRPSFSVSSWIYSMGDKNWFPYKTKEGLARLIDRNLNDSMIVCYMSSVYRSGQCRINCDWKWALEFLKRLQLKLWKLATANHSV